MFTELYKKKGSTQSFSLPMWEMIRYDHRIWNSLVWKRSKVLKYVFTLFYITLDYFWTMVCVQIGPSVS